MDKSISRNARYSLSKPIRIFFGTWLLLGILPFPIAMGGAALGYRFLPSAEWVSTTGGFGNFMGLAVGILMFGLFLVRHDLIQGGAIRKAGVVLFSPALGYVVGSHSVIIAGPMALALVAGHHVELPYTVARADKPTAGRCNRPLELQGLVFAFDRLCGVPDEIRESLRPGMHIVIEGRGTSYGVFASAFRRDD